jgi:hypothetical protein
MATNDRNGVIDSSNIDLEDNGGIGFQEDPNQPDDQHYEEPEQPEEEIEQEDEQFEEEEHPEPEEQRYEQEDRKPKPKAKEKDRTRERLNEIQREKYQALDELARLREENQQLRQMSDIASNSASVHYEDNVNRQVERARNLKMAAIDSGDVEAQVNADVELATAVAKMNRLNEWKAEKAADQYAPVRQAPQQPDLSRNPEALRWADKNQWMSPSSEDYDPDMAYKADSYAAQLDQYLVQQGQANMIGSRDYFYEIDKFVNHARDQVRGSQQSRTGQQQRGQLNMKQSRPAVSPVRSGGSQGRAQQVQLSASERDMVRRMGISEQAYVKSKLEIQREDKNGRDGR